MTILLLHSAYLWCMSAHHIHVNAACPRCMFVLHAHFHTACQVYAACLWNGNLVDVHVVSPCCITNQIKLINKHLEYSCPCCLSMLHVPAACPCCMSVLHFCAACLRCILCCLTLLHANVYGSFKGNVAWDWDWLKVMLLDWTVLEEEPLVVFKCFQMLLRLFKNVNRNAALHEKELEIATFQPPAAGKYS